MATATSLLNAGALLPPKQKVPKDEVVDTVSARTYYHPGLGDRPVVRLSQDALADGEDLAMEYLGFGAAEVAGPVGKSRRQALGFPAWALINDPKHAHYALQVVKLFRKAAKRSKSKPGHGFDEFASIAQTLGRQVPHFLPSFWEQVGREFIYLGNRTYGARAFGKARDAENVHALEINEDVRQEAFLEFALAGCISAKALIAYAKELQDAKDPVDAWHMFRDLCIRRVRGGIPPWSSMGKDLERIIKAADLDVHEEAKSLLREIVSAPCMSNTSEKFWQHYEKSLAELVQESDEVAGALINLIPQSGYSGSWVWAWIEMLKAWGILSNVWDPRAPQAAQPQAGPAAWFGRRVQAGQDNAPATAYEVLRAMGKRLKKDKVPVVLAKERWGRCEIPAGLLDLALELGVPIARSDKDQFDLRQWGEDKEPIIRGLDFVAADEYYRPLLYDGVASAIGDGDFDEAAAGRPAMAEARREWLLDVINKMRHGGLPGLAHGLERISRVTNRETFREFGDAFPLLEKVDIDELVRGTLQRGVLDEFGWAALEEAAAELNPTGTTKLTYHGTFPHVIVTNGVKAIVVSPTERLADYELKIPKKSKVEDLRYIEGQLAIMVSIESTWDFYLIWSGDPKTKHELGYASGNGIPSGVAVPVGDGGEFDGNCTLHAGGKSKPDDPEPFSADGEHFWSKKYDWQTEQSTFHEVSPRNGKLGRESMPSYFEDYIRDGWKLQADHCFILPLGRSVPDSPLGVQDEMIGFRSRRKGNELQCESIGGLSWQGKWDFRNGVRALMQFPGSKEVCLVAANELFDFGY